MLGYFVIVVAIPVYAALGAPIWGTEDNFYVVPNDTVQCVNDLVEWCDGMKYPQEGAGMSMVSITVAQPDGFCRILCTSDFGGTNCTRNGSPWLTCSKDNMLFYKGNQLTANSTGDVDDDICKTANNAFNDVMVQNLSYDNETVNDELVKGMESFFEQMARMQEQIDALQRKLRDMFGGGFGDYFDVDEELYRTKPRKNETADETDQIEKE